MADLAQVAANLEARREALPIEIAVHVASCIVRYADRAQRLQGLAEIQLEQVLIDPHGRVFLRPCRGRCTEGQLIRSIGLLLFELLAGERLGDRPEAPLGVLAKEEVPEGLIRIVARAVAGRHDSLEQLLEELSQWSALRKARISPPVIADFLTRYELVAPPPVVKAPHRTARWFVASALGLAAGVVFSAIVLLSV